MIVTAAATIAALSIGAIVFWCVVVPLTLGTIEWAFNIGNVRQR